MNNDSIIGEIVVRTCFLLCMKKHKTYFDVVSSSFVALDP